MDYIGSKEHLENFKRAGILGNIKIQQLKQQRIDEYNKNPNKCKKCEKVLSYEERTKTFCSNSCRVSITNKGRHLKETTKEKIRKSLQNRGHEDVEKICPECDKTFKIHWNKRNQVYCSRTCSRKNNGSCESARKKISEKVQQRLKDGTFSGWKTRKDKAPSYAEQYFINLFNNENIVGWQRDYKAGRWFIDFAFLDKKIALEIDGKQHEERKEQDKIKDDFLSENGWKVFRIKWVNPTNDKNKEKLYTQINIFKSWI